MNYYDQFIDCKNLSIYSKVPYYYIQNNNHCIKWEEQIQALKGWYPFYENVIPIWISIMHKNFNLKVIYRWHSDEWELNSKTHFSCSCKITE